MTTARREEAADGGVAADRGLIVLVMTVGPEYTRRAVLGIRAYTRVHSLWDLRLMETFPRWDEWVPRERERARGIIGVFGHESEEEAALHAGLPCVNLSGRLPRPRLPSVLPDDKAAARLAATFYLERGFHRFAYVGLLSRGYSRARCDAFTAAVAEAGHAVEVQDIKSAAQLTAVRERTGPTALFADTDFTAVQLVRLLLAAGRRVPEDVAVLGMDNDAIQCELSDVPLTSIDSHAQRIGWEAARLLNHLMRGIPPPDGPVLVVPRGVVARESTATCGSDDPLVVSAAGQIYRQACGGVRVSDLLPALGASRRTVEKRFRRAMGRTLLEEMERVRLDQSRTVLTETNVSVHEVARMCGFPNLKRFRELFRAAYGILPSDFRRQFLAR